jgi:hypothetical protein
MPFLTDGATNTQIRNANRDGLTALQRQVRFVMQEELALKPCPNCGALHNLPMADGVHDIDEYDFANRHAEHGDRHGPCRTCGRTLIFVLPLMGDWHWALDPSEAPTVESSDAKGE